MTSTPQPPPDPTGRHRKDGPVEPDIDTPDAAAVTRQPQGKHERSATLPVGGAPVGATSATATAVTTGQGRRPSRLKVVVGALLVLLAWFAVAGVGGTMTGKLSEVQTNDNANFLPADAESTAVMNAMTKFQDSSQLPFFMTIEAGDDKTLDQAAFGKLATFAASIPDLAVDGIPGKKVRDYLSDPQAKIVPVPSKDQKAALIIITANADQVIEEVGGKSPLNGIAQVLRDKGTAELAGVAGAGTTAAVHLGGPGGLFSDFAAAFAGIDGILLGVALLVVLVILLIVYRSPVLPVMVLLSAIFGLAAAGLAVYPLAKAGAIELSGQSQGIMFILVVGAATDYALLLVSRFKEELHDEADSWVALRTAWRASVEPIVASAATVIAGLLCLLLADLKSTAGLGPVGAFGVAGAMLAALTFLPAMLAIFGRFSFWPFRPKVDHQHRADAVGSRGIWGRVAGMVGAHPRRTWVITLALLLGAAAFIPTLKSEGASTADSFRVEVDSIKALKTIERHFPAGSGNPVQILVPQDKAQAVVDLLAKEDGVEQPYIGLAPPVPGQPAPAPVVRDGKVIVQATLDDPAESRAAEEVVSRLRSNLDSVSTDAVVGGSTAINADVRTASDRDLKVIVPSVLAVIFLVLCLLLRSLVAPLLLVAANVVSFAATMGISALAFNHLFHFKGSDSSITLYGFVFLVALGIDYSIFLMTRVREESMRLGTRRGILTGLAVTGGVITSAGIVLAATFSALAVLPLVFLAQIAFIVAFGVLLDTLVVRSLLVPALSYDIGRRIWAPSKLAKHAE